ncbi:MAG: hypothetical protein Q9218_007995 [Villophora microphyllina]
MSSRPASLSPPPLKRRRISRRRASSSTSSPQISLIPRTPRPEPHSGSKPAILRVYSWNINGIAPYLDQQRPITKFFPTTSSNSTSKSTNTPHPHSFRACFRRWSFPHIVCLQEVKVAPSDTSSQSSVRRIINTALNEDDPTNSSNRLYDAHFNLPRDKYNATGFGGKVYGVCTLIRRNLAPSTSIKIPDWDLEGRVHILELRKYGTVVFNVYAVNGTTNPYRSPESGKVIGDRHMRKRQLHEELRDECVRYEARGWHTVIAGDINISQTPLDSYPQLRMGKEHQVNRAHFKECFLKAKEGGLGMRDSFRQVRGQERKYSYRPPGRKWGEGMDRVDLILVGRGVELKGADILDTEADRGTSDHVPLWVEVEVPLVGHTRGDETNVREEELSEQ